VPGVSWELDPWREPIGAGFAAPSWVEMIVRPDRAEDPTVTARIEIRAGRPQLVALAVKAADRGRELRTSDLRQINVDALVVNVLAEWAERPVEVAPGVWGSKPLTQQEAEAAWHQVQRARSVSKPRHTDARLEEAARVYRDNIGEAPTEAVKRHFRVAHSTASDYVRAARDRGFLPETRQGKAKA